MCWNSGQLWFIIIIFHVKFNYFTQLMCGSSSSHNWYTRKSSTQMLPISCLFWSYFWISIYFPSGSDQHKFIGAQLVCLCMCLMMFTKMPFSNHFIDLLIFMIYPLCIFFIIFAKSFLISSARLMQGSVLRKNKNILI